MKLNLAEIKTGIDSNSRILKNMSWLAALQFANCIIPLVLIPYIIRTTELKAFGKISYAQNIAVRAGCDTHNRKHTATQRRCQQIQWRKTLTFALIVDRNVEHPQL